MSYRIIIADPSPSVQKIAPALFPEPEFRLYPFDDGQALLEAVAEVRPDAVLVSLSLAAPGGAEIGRALRSVKGLSGFPLIGLRGTFEPADMDGVQEGDYDAIVRKPFDSERLAVSVRELIARKTGPSTMPEEPGWPSTADLDGDSASSAPGGDPAEVAQGDAPPEPPRRGDDQNGVPGPGFREWFRREISGLEQEIEKRVRARLLAEFREWMSGESRGPGPKE